MKRTTLVWIGISVAVVLFLGFRVYLRTRPPAEEPPYAGPVEKITVANIGLYSILNLIANVALVAWLGLVGAGLAMVLTIAVIIASAASLVRRNYAQTGYSGPLTRVALAGALGGAAGLLTRALDATGWAQALVALAALAIATAGLRTAWVDGGLKWTTVRQLHEIISDFKPT